MVLQPSKIGMATIAGTRAEKTRVLEPVRTFIVRWHKTPDGRVDRTTSNLSFFPGMKPVASENLIFTAASDEIRT